MQGLATSCMPAVCLRLERAQEIQQVLLLGFRQTVEVPDDGVGFRAGARVILDRLHKIGRPPVMQEEQPLAQSPERSRTELIRSRTSLRNPIGQPRPHMVNQQIGEQIRLDVAKRRDV